MTNFEKYKDEILKIVTESHSNPAVKDGVVVACAGLDCDKCDFSGAGNCSKNRFEWLYKNDGEQELTCSSCKYASKDADEYPCSECSRGYTDRFKRKPKKTRQSEFLKMFPNTRVHNGVLVIASCGIEGNEFKKQNCNSYERCIDCRKDYWLEEVEK